MKPPIDWSPCQQKGEEHEWIQIGFIGQWGISSCDKCGVLVREDG